MVIIPLAGWITVLGGHARNGILEMLVAWLGAGVASVAVAGIILGQCGLLHVRGGFLAVHVVTLVTLLVLRSKQIRRDFLELGTALRNARATLEGSIIDRWLALALGLILLVLIVMAAGAAPVIYDGLAYRLPRIGAWLQSGRITILPTDDARLSHMPVVPDVVMAWLLTATTSGYGLIALASAVGGVLTTTATIGLAVESGLGRRAAILAALLLLGMANVLAQFTSTQTDLFTAGIFSAAFYLGFRAVRRGEFPGLGAVGAGLALGSKGTVIYFAPGAAIWLAWLLRGHRLPWRVWWQSLLLAGFSAIVFVGPVFARNWMAYGGLFGSAEAVRKHQRLPDSPADLAQKLTLNLVASLAQLFDPNSQPAGLHDASRWVGSQLVRLLPTEDPDAFETRGRRVTVEQILERREPDADTTSFGVVIAALFLLGGLLAMKHRRNFDARVVLLWCAGVLTFLLFISAIQQWHGYGYRFFVLAAPWVAVAGAWGIEQIAAPWRNVVWIAALTCAASTAWHVMAHTHQIGWRAIIRPERSLGYHVYLNWREWSHNLTPRSLPVSVALPENLPLAAFFRQSDRNMTLRSTPEKATAEEAVPQDGSWLVVSARRFIGAEGNVQARAWLFRGDEANVFSIAAYRALRPGEWPVAVMYRCVRTLERGECRFDLILRTWSAEPVQLEFLNHGPGERRFSIVTPSGGLEGVAPTGKTTVPVSLPADHAVQVKVVFAQIEGDSPDPEIRLVTPEDSTITQK